MESGPLETRQVTIYRRGAFGYQKIEARAYCVTVGRWAQYPAAVKVQYLLPRKRNAVEFVETSNPGLVVVDGWNNPAVASPMDVTSQPGDAMTTSISRHSCFSGSWDTEFSAFIEPLIASGAVKVLHDFRKHNASAPGKIAIKDVTITWSESDRQDLVGKAMRTWEEANHAIAIIATGAPEGRAYNKTAFRITWADGETYEGRIDVTRSMISAPRALTEHVRGFNARLSGREADASLAEIRAATERQFPGAIERAGLLLDTRDIGA